MVTVKELNERLTKQPYLSGYTPGEEDAKCFVELFGDNVKVAQWAARMASYYPSERAAMQVGAAEQGDESDQLDE